MLAGFQVLWQALKDVRHKGYTYIWANIAFVVCSLPVITLPAAYRALMRIGYNAQSSPHETDLSAFWDTFREDFKQSLGWGLAHFAFGLVNITNLIAYQSADGLVFVGLRFIWLASTFIWIGVLLYTWTLYNEMETPSLLGATRNAVVMVLQNPFFTAIVCLGIVLVCIISTFLVALWALLTFGVISSIANIAVVNRLSHYREIQI